MFFDLSLKFLFLASFSRTHFRPPALLCARRPPLVGASGGGANTSRGRLRCAAACFGEGRARHRQRGVERAAAARQGCKASLHRMQLRRNKSAREHARARANHPTLPDVAAQNRGQPSFSARRRVCGSSHAWVAGGGGKRRTHLGCSKELLCDHADVGQSAHTRTHRGRAARALRGKDLKAGVCVGGARCPPSKKHKHGCVLHAKKKKTAARCCGFF